MRIAAKPKPPSLAFQAVEIYCINKGYPRPYPEYAFHPTRKWRFDACWPLDFVAVEFQGGAFSRGRHTRGKGFSDDAEKFANAAVLGWRVIPVTTEQLNAGMLWGYLDQIFGGKTT